MEYSSLLTDSKWNIIKEIAKEEQTPTNLANKLNTSIANISQQLRLLEAYGLVKKKKLVGEEKHPGKPKNVYSLNKEVAEVMLITNETTIKKTIDLNPIKRATIQAWLNLKSEDSYTLHKFIFTNEELLKKCDAINIVRITGDTMELMLVTEHIQEIRQKYSNQTIKTLEDKEKKIICWTHNLEDVKNGLKNNEEYFLQLTDNLKPFLDKKEVLQKIKAMKNGKDN